MSLKKRNDSIDGRLYYMRMGIKEISIKKQVKFFNNLDVDAAPDLI